MKTLMKDIMIKIMNYIVVGMKYIVIGMKYMVKYGKYAGLKIYFIIKWICYGIYKIIKWICYGIYKIIKWFFFNKKYRIIILLLFSMLLVWIFVFPHQMTLDELIWTIQNINNGKVPRWYIEVELKTLKKENLEEYNKLFLYDEEKIKEIAKKIMLKYTKETMIIWPIGIFAIVVAIGGIIVLVMSG